MLEACCSAGVERDPDLAGVFGARVEEAAGLSREVAREGLERHREFVAERDEEPGYEAEHYDTRVVTKAERGIQLPTVAGVERESTEHLRFVANHEAY